ncbi:MAG TPA: HAD family phosphatase [Chitinophagaceae bacterium]|nr:HAD family phosphatase [Chitinophagaceae bacterium]
MSSSQFAVIFDMDGTMMDNNPFHLLAWKQFCRDTGRDLSVEEYQQKISGRVNKDILRYLSNSQLTDEKIQELSDRKEQIYRELYLPHIAPLKGFLSLIKELKTARIKMGIATSAQPVNIEFAMNLLELHPYFDVLVDSTFVKKGKPDPEIFLTTAKLLGETAGSCLVFEDSLSGIRGARAAEMRTIGVTTTHPEEELFAAGADFCIPDYVNVTLSVLQNKFMELKSADHVNRSADTW